LEDAYFIILLEWAGRFFISTRSDLRFATAEVRSNTK